MKQTRTSTSSHALLDEYTLQSSMARLSTSMQINTYFLDYIILVISCAWAVVASITSRSRSYVQRSRLHPAHANSFLVVKVVDVIIIVQACAIVLKLSRHGRPPYSILWSACPYNTNSRKRGMALPVSSKRKFSGCASKRTLMNT